ncbi:hypothetical protein [Metallibacterium scheffleri]|uniref:hypothetical protein n=1 Tax=Metallibacterium scheffleri TaxID=993689 RepID=UPI00109F1584|nr:hypothetical protein [Metallibacterium scheffleri]
MTHNKSRVNLATSAKPHSWCNQIARAAGGLMILLSSLSAVLYPIPALASYAMHQTYQYPTYHDSRAVSVPSFKSGVCVHGTIEKGHFSIAKLATHQYFFLHLDKPINVMPPVSRDPAFLNPYFHTYDIGLLMSMQYTKLASSITHSQNKKISLTGEIQIIMMGGGESQPPLSIFLDVSKIGGANKCAL